MANNGRVTAAEVKEGFETDLIDSEIDAWVNTATELVDDIEDEDSSIDSTRLKQIELALTRHFASAQDPRMERERVADVTLTHQGDTGMRIDSTTYGQQAAMLDPTGILASTGKPSPGLTVVDAKGID